MKKVFRLSDPKKHEDRVLESIKHEIRKYMKREKKKSLPDKQTMYWSFDCKVGLSSEDAKIVKEEELIKALDTIKSFNSKEVYVEIMAKVTMKPIKDEKPLEDNED